MKKMREKQANKNTIEYYNSMDTDIEQIQVYLMSGRRTPQNEKERQLLKEIREIEAKGRVVEVLSSGL